MKKSLLFILITLHSLMATGGEMLNTLNLRKKAFSQVVHGYFHCLHSGKDCTAQQKRVIKTGLIIIGTIAAIGTGAGIGYMALQCRKQRSTSNNAQQTNNNTITEQPHIGLTPERQNELDERLDSTLIMIKRGIKTSKAALPEVQELLKQGANPNQVASKGNVTIFMHALELNEFALAEAMLNTDKNKADLNSRTTITNETLHDIATRLRDSAMLLWLDAQEKRLNMHGSQPSNNRGVKSVNSKPMLTPVQQDQLNAGLEGIIAQSGARDQDQPALLEKVKNLLAQGADPNAWGYTDNRTLFMEALVNHRFAIADAMFATGRVDLSKQSKKTGNTIYQIATLQNDDEILNWLEQHQW
jgi:hypothetical protein